MATIIPFLQDAAFEPHDIQAMSMALDDVCKELNVPSRDHPARQVIAERIIALARQGLRSPAMLRDRVLDEASLADMVGLSEKNGLMEKAGATRAGSVLKDVG